MESKLIKMEQKQLALHLKSVGLDNNIIDNNMTQTNLEFGIVNKNMIKTDEAKMESKTNKIIEQPQQSSFGRAENVIKCLKSGHLLISLNRVRVKGYCVECIKTTAGKEYKSVLQKITTYCPKCPGGNWVCEACFYSIHGSDSD